MYLLTLLPDLLKRQLIKSNQYSALCTVITVIRHLFCLGSTPSYYGCHNIKHWFVKSATKVSRLPATCKVYIWNASCHSIQVRGIWSETSIVNLRFGVRESGVTSVETIPPTCRLVLLSGTVYIKPHICNAEKKSILFIIITHLTCKPMVGLAKLYRDRIVTWQVYIKLLGGGDQS